MAAPWKGSTALGWLWDSTLKATAWPVADVDGAGVLARAHHHPLALGRQPAEQLARVLVGAVLGPEQREHRQLDVVRLAAEQLDDALVLGVGEPELAVWRLGRRPSALTPRRARRASARNSASPSSEPVSGSTACSGCGIRPSTLPASLATPAMSRTEPFGFWPGA